MMSAKRQLNEEERAEQNSSAKHFFSVNDVFTKMWKEHKNK